MQWIIHNWFWVLIAVAFIWMHFFGHGGHGGHGGMKGNGGHGGHGGGCGSSGMRKGESNPERQRPTSDKSSPHETGQHNH